MGHLSRDSTAIEAREKPAAKEKAPPPPKRKRGRLKKGEERPKVLKRLDRQATMSLPAMLDDLPTACDVGMKKDSKGYKLGRLQAAHRRGRRPDSDQLPADVRLAARQPSRHSAGDVVGRADDQSHDLMDAVTTRNRSGSTAAHSATSRLIDTTPAVDKTLAEELEPKPAPEKSGFQLASRFAQRASAGGASMAAQGRVWRSPPPWRLESDVSLHVRRARTHRRPGSYRLVT